MTRTRFLTRKYVYFAAAWFCLFLFWVMFTNEQAHPEPATVIAYVKVFACLISSTVFLFLGGLVKRSR